MSVTRVFSKESPLSLSERMCICQKTPEIGKERKLISFQKINVHSIGRMTLEVRLVSRPMRSRRQSCSVSFELLQGQPDPAEYSVTGK